MDGMEGRVKNFHSKISATTHWILRIIDARFYVLNQTFLFSFISGFLFRMEWIYLLNKWEGAIVNCFSLSLLELVCWNYLCSW